VDPQTRRHTGRLAAGSCVHAVCPPMNSLSREGPVYVDDRVFFGIDEPLNPIDAGLAATLRPSTSVRPTTHSSARG
jgi:hypothetical protein